MEKVVLSEDSVSAPGDVISSPATYATLTPLQPLSPLSLEKADSVYGGISRGLLAEANRGNNLIRCYGFDVGCSLLSDYELLEPLKPTVFIDKEGNAVDYNENQTSSTWSYLSHPTFLTSRLSSCDWNGKNELGKSDSTNDDSSSNQWSRDGVDESRAPSPDTSLHPSVHQSPTSTSVSYTPNPTLLAALSTVATTEELEEFMNSEVVETRDLSSLIGYEIKRLNIPQVLFAQRVLGRSQGTLSDLLRNPRPWTKLKTGRDQFAKIWQWLRVPESQRLLPFMNSGYKFDADSSDATFTTTSNSFSSSSSFSEALSQDSNDGTPVKQRKNKSTPPGGTGATSTTSVLEKRPRVLFNDSQRLLLQTAFDKEPRPTKEQQVALAEQLNLPCSSISNFFVNSRRRLRNLEKEESEAAARSKTESDLPETERTGQLSYFSGLLE